MEERSERKSICYMSLADAFLTRLRKDAENRSRQRMVKGISVEVLPVKIDRHDFIYDYLTKLHSQKKGTFNKAKTFTKQTIYECERSNVCKGNSSGDPTKTRANGCSAYVSFMFQEGATITACVIRSRLTHCGHNPSNREEARVNRIDLSLKSHIEMNIRRGMKTSDVMNEIGKWNKIHKNIDHRNRRYFPSRHDIQQLALSLNKPDKISNTCSTSFSLKRPRKFDLVKRDNIARLLRTEFRESCVYYQSQTTAGANPRPLILVLQNHDQREMASVHGRQIVFIDKNYEGLRQYGNAIYVLVVRDSCDNGFPIAYIITSSDDSFTFIQALEKLKARCPLNPRVFFLERELQRFTEMMARVFPESLFLISSFQVLHEVHKWLQSSPVSEKEHSDVRRVLLQFVQELKACSREDDLLAASEMQQRIEFEAFTSMMEVELLSAPMWCDFGRNFLYEGSITGFQTERFFLRIKHQFLKGLHTRKSLEDVLRLLLSITVEQRNFVDGMVNMSALLEGTASDQAVLLLQQGWSQLVTWQGQWLAHVPCHDMLETTYRVNLITMECDCALLTYMGPCVHLCLVVAMIQSRDGLTPDQERHRCASEAFENSDFIMDVESCTTFHNNVICVTKLESGMCTCVASALDVECVGKILLKIYLGTEEAVTYTVPDDTAMLSTKILNANVSAGAEVTESDKESKEPTKPEVTPKLTICVLTETKGSVVVSDEPVHDISNQPIIIQTHTRTQVINEDQLFSPPNHPLENITLINIKTEDLISPKASTLSSQAIIEKLYKWSKSKTFTDSKALHDHLQNAYNLISKSQNDVLQVQKDRESQSGKVLANKSLRTTIRSVKRPNNQFDDDDANSLMAMLPALKVSRSGRTIKIKEEPDFIM